MSKTPTSPTIALLPWGDLFEDFLDSIGVSLETFFTELSGGWLFGYVDALRLAGVHTVIIIFSVRTRTPVRRTHLPTGATIVILPVSTLYRILYHTLLRPYARMVQHPERINRLQYWLRPFLDRISRMASYLSTPLGLLRRELEALGCDAILCQEYEDPRFDLCVLLGLRKRIPVFATFQGGARPRGLLARLWRSAIIRGSRGLIIGPHNEAQRVAAQYHVSPAKIARIFNPLDLELWQASGRAEVRAALQIPPQGRVVVWHGRVSIHIKGLDLLLDAWEQVCSLAQKRPEKQELRLLLVGTGEDAPKLCRRLQERPLPGVLWVNEYLRDRTQIRQYLSAGDLYVLTSRREGFPVAPLEAMACGLPVVATRVQGIPDILSEEAESGGLIVPPDDPEQLAHTLIRLLENAALARELGVRARKRVESAFSLQSVGQQLRRFLLSGDPSR